MEERKWHLKQVGDFTYLLDDRSPGEKDKLQHRFKKDLQALGMIFTAISKIEKRGFIDGIHFGYVSSTIKTVETNKKLSLIEIRIKKALWRVVTYIDRDREQLVMLDAFEAHKGKTMDQMVNEVEPLVRIAKELLKEID